MFRPYRIRGMKQAWNLPSAVKHFVISSSTIAYFEVEKFIS